jgi:ribosomal protein S24E
MSMIETVSDVENSFLSRREITCNFQGLGGKLKKNEAIDMITKEFNLANKTVIAINMKNQTGRPNITGMFYVYDSEELAKKQVNPTIFERLERRAKKDAEAAPAEEVASEAPAEEVASEAPAEEVASEAPAEVEKKE